MRIRGVIEAEKLSKHEQNREKTSTELKFLVYLPKTRNLCLDENASKTTHRDRFLNQNFIRMTTFHHLKNQWNKNQFVLKHCETLEPNCAVAKHSVH